MTYADLKVPGPTTIALTEPFWSAAEQGRLLIQRCRHCDRTNLYPRALCPHCWSDRLEWQDASGAATLKSFSVVHKPGHPGWLPAAPYVVGLVTLAEGPTMLSLILSGGRPKIGAPLALAPTNIGGRVLPAFRIENRETVMSGTEKDGWAGTIRGRPAVGQVAERSRTTSMADIEAFSAMTGDFNPLHYDKALAEKTPFGRLIVQGGVTSGMLNAVVAEDLPGPGTVFLGVEWKFVKAVGVDETITAQVEVLEVRSDKPICKLRTTIRNSAGEDCLTGTANTYTMPLAR